MTVPRRDGMALREGDPAPDFEAVSHTGDRVRLTDYRGRIVVLYFYPRAMTPGCTREALRFNELLGEFKNLGAAVIGVSTDKPEGLKRFAEKHSLSFTLLSDPEGQIASLYGVLKRSEKTGRLSAERATFIIGRGGIISKVLRNIRPAEKHADLALEHAKALSLQA